MSGPEDDAGKRAPPPRRPEPPRRATPSLDDAAPQSAGRRRRGRDLATERPPPVRPAALDGPPPALRPRGADATIPLAPPEPEVPMRTPVPDVGRITPGRPEPRKARRARPPAPPPESAPTPVTAGGRPAEPLPPPPEDTAADAPEPDQAPPEPPQQHASDGHLGSDDDLFDAFPESVSPDLDDADFGDIDEEPEPAPAPRIAWWRTLLAPPEPPPPGRTVSRLTRHLSYEVVVVVVTFCLASVLLFTSFDGEMRDVYVKGREILGGYPAHTSGEVALVTVGEEALYLWDPSSGPPDITPRAMLGEVVSVLDAAGADVIVLDFLLDTPQPGDERLAEAASAHGRVVAAERFVLTDPATGGRFAAGPAPALGESLATGYANLGEEALWTSAEERLVRSGHMVEVIDRARLQSAWPASVGQAQAESEITPHMALLAAWLHRHPDASSEDLLARLGASCDKAPLSCTTSYAELGLGDGPPLESRLPLNFRGPEHADGLPTLRASELLRIGAEPALYRLAGVDKPLDIPDWLREAVDGKIIVVGRVDAKAGDRFATPFGFPVPVRADMDGARIQAQTIDTLLTGRHASRVPAWVSWALAAGLLGGLVVSARFLREDVHTALALGSCVLLVVVGTAVFYATDGVVLDLAVPLTTVLLGTIAIRLRGWAVD